MRHLGLLALSLAICLSVAGSARAASYRWSAGGGADTSWNTLANWDYLNGNSWVPATSLPAPTDDSEVYGGWFQWQTKTITMPSGTTTVHNFLVDGYWMNMLNVLGSGASMNVTGDFTYNNSIIYYPTCTFTVPVTVAGKVITSNVSDYANAMDAILFTTSSDTFTGGFNVSGNQVEVNSNGNTVNGTIAVIGYSWDNYRCDGNTTGAGAHGSYGGVLYFGGTGNAYGVTSVTLNDLGIVDFAQSSNLSSVTSLNFNGGFLRLQSAGNTFSALPGGFNVKSGTLWVTTDASLGDPALNAIQLGDTWTTGILAGSAGGAGVINRPITLNGLGGVIRTEYAELSIGSTISGSGALVKIGNSTTGLVNNGIMALTPNTYTGGTTVTCGTLWVDTNRTLGTGNVNVLFGSTLALTAAGQVDPAASVLVKAVPLGCRSTLAITGDYMPTLNPASDGIFQLVNPWTNPAPGSAIYAALGAGIAGDGTNGKLWMGGQSWGGWYNGPLAPGQPMTAGGKPTYRFSSGAINWEAVVFLQSNCLVGDTDVILDYGSMSITGANTFTGTLTIKDTLSRPANYQFWGDRTHIAGAGATAPTASGTSPFGAATGDVKLENGAIGLSGAAGGQLVLKNDLSYDGAGAVAVTSGAAPGVLTEMTFQTLTRVDKGNLIVMSTANGLGVGGMEKLRVNGTVPTDSGIVAPYIVAANLGNTGDYLTYNTTDGFTKTSYVAMPASPGAGAEIVSTGAVALGGDVSVAALKATGAITGANTVTINSGGLMLLGAGLVQHTANFKFGAAGGKEAVIFVNGDSSSMYNAPELDGQLITTGGLTKTGPGALRLGPANTGSNTPDRTAGLVGDIYVNQGALVVTADKELGALTNNVHLNGGILKMPGNNGNSVTTSRTIYVGANGGAVSDDNNGVWVLNGAFADEVPGKSGPVAITSYPTINCSSPNFSGGAIIGGGRIFLTGTAQPLGTGPITILDGASLFLCAPATIDQSSSRVTVNGTGFFNVGYCGMRIGSLQGDGRVLMGCNDQGPNVDGLPLYMGTDNTDADFYGNIENLDFCGLGLLFKEGAGTQTLWGTISNHGATMVDGGTLRINGLMTGGSLALPAVNVNNGGTLEGKGKIVAPIAVNSGGNLNGSLTINGSVTSYGGTVNMTGATINGAVILGVDTYPNGAATFNNSTINGIVRIGVSLATSTVTGTFTGTNVTINDPASFVISNGAFIGTNVTVTMPTDSVLTIGGATASHVGSISGTGNSFTGCYTNLVNGTITGSNTFTATGLYGFYINNGGAAPCSVSGNNTITTASNSILGMGVAGSPAANTVLSGSNTINSCVYMYSGTLSGPNTIHGNTRGALVVQPNSYAVVSPHVGDTAGTLAIVGDVTLDHSTTLNFNLGAPGTVGGGINDLIDVTGNVSLDGTLNVTGLTYFGQGTYTLLTYTGTLTNNLTLGTMPTGGYTYSFTSGTFHAGTVYELNLSVVSPFQPGDTNHDGVLNSLDIDAIYHNFNAAANSQWKVTTDGLVVGQQDVTYELRKYFLTNYGDANLDNATDFPDFQTLLDHWQASGSTIGWAQGDFNGDYSVDFLDFQKLLDYWNPGGWHYAPMATPEPASLSLLVLGGLALLRRKK